MCGKFLVANSCGLLYIELDRGHMKFLSIFPFTLHQGSIFSIFILKMSHFERGVYYSPML